MAIRRVALIYDDRARPETTGVYCRRALERLVEVEHFRPDELAGSPATASTSTSTSTTACVTACRPICGPRPGGPSTPTSTSTGASPRRRDFDLVFAAQRDGAERLRRAGIASATWLPLACDPEIHRKHEVAKQYDVAFVGNVFPGPRAELLEPAPAAVSRLVHRPAPTSRRWPGPTRRARTVFNRSIKNDVNMRVFEAAGVRLAAADQRSGDNGQAELFRDGVHLATYREPRNCSTSWRFTSARRGIRERIAAAGRAEALAKHTYRHRMERLLARRRKRALATDRRSSNPACIGGCPTVLGRRHDPFYFEHARPEIAGASVPTSARSVLDIGCGAGRLGEALKARQPAEVVGIELNEAAAAAGRQRLDEVLVGDVERLELDFPPGSFDAIVCGDILEHLRDPDRLLRQARSWLAPDGRLVASIPNVRHHSVVRSLLEGNWTYESAGLLDRTHLRFFTRREIEKLFFRAGFAVEELRSSPRPGDDPRQRSRARRGPRRPAPHRRALRRRGRRVLRLPVPGPSPGRRRCPTTA